MNRYVNELRNRWIMEKTQNDASEYGPTAKTMYTNKRYSYRENASFKDHSHESSIEMDKSELQFRVPIGPYTYKTVVETKHNPLFCSTI